MLSTSIASSDKTKTGFTILPRNAVPRSSQSTFLHVALQLASLPDPNAQGLGDLLLNYRRQVLYEGDHVPAFAPRLSLILPTGDEDAGLGSGSVGYQVMLPASKIVGNRMTLHGNAEVTSYVDVDGQQPTSYLDQSVGDTGRIESETSYTVSPGARCAFNLSAGQLVLAAGAPILFADESVPDYGAYFYLSFEHRFR